MSKSQIRIGILGGGSMGAVHADAYRTIDSVEVVGVFSRSRERAEAVARICSTAAVTDASLLLDDPTIAAIDVCLPSAVHPEFVVAALERGKHVFCETPFALELGPAEAMIDAAQKFNRILLVGLLMRSIAEYEYVRRVAVSQQCGKLLSIMAYRLGSYLRVSGPDHKEHYTDPSTELMTFDLDFILWLMGPPTNVSATAVTTDRGTAGEISALLDYGDGRSATVLASGILPNSFAFSSGFRVLFEMGAFELKTSFARNPPESTFRFYPEGGSPEAVAIRGHNPYEKELRYFADCLRGEADPTLLDAQRALEALTLSVATQQSLQARQAVAIDFASTRLKRDTT
jgi:UDP-N-acetylglucosamine 3-dehydrogenase